MLFRSDGVSVVQKTPYQINVSADEIVTDQKSLDVIFTGTLQDGFSLENHALSESIISITGPKRYVEQVKGASITVNLDEITGDFEKEYSVRLYDENGEEYSNRYVSYTKKIVKFTATAKKAGNVPLNVNVIPNDVITSDMIKVTISPSSLSLKGEKEIVDTLQNINLGEIYISKCLENNEFEFTFPVKLPEGVKAENVTDLAATVKIEILGMKEKTIVVPKERFIEVLGYEYLANEVEVKLLVKEDEYDKIDAEDIIITPVYSPEEFENGTLEKVNLNISSSTHQIAALGKYIAEVGKLEE